jgi:endonuclease VIII
MEGPSLFLASEQLVPFIGQKVFSAGGNTRLAKERLVCQRVISIFSWGKHLVLQFESFALRIHFMLYGTFEAIAEGQKITGYCEKKGTPRLSLEFDNGRIRLYACSLEFIESSQAKNHYDFSIDLISPEWDGKQAVKNLSAEPEREIGDALLDQTLFAGLGNIIKNEILYREKLHPELHIHEIPKKTLANLVQTAKSFSLQFYEWRKAYILRKNLAIYQKTECPHCHQKIIRRKTGIKKR